MTGKTVPAEELRKAELRAHVSENIALAAGLTQEQRYFPRIAAIRKLGKHLTTNDIDALYFFLDSRFADQHEMGITAFNALKNDILNALNNQEKVPEDLGMKLVRMYRDTSHDEVWRDYCIQHLCLFYQARWPRGVDDVVNKQRDEMQGVFWEALADKGKATAGTAINMLEMLSRNDPESPAGIGRNADRVRTEDRKESEDADSRKGTSGGQRYPEFDRKKVAEMALKLAEDPQACEGARITATAVCGNIGYTNALPSLRIMAQTAETVLLRMTAIASLGSSGEDGDLEILQALCQDKEPRIRTAAESAVRRLKRHLATYAPVGA